MKHRLSAAFIRKKCRQPVYGAGVFSVIVLGFGVYALIGSGNAGVFIFLAMAALVAVVVFRNYKLWRYWNLYGPQLEFEVTDGALIERGATGESSVAKTAIERVDVQLRRGAIASLLFKTKTGGVGKLEGFEDMEQLRRDVEVLVGPENIRERRWLHR